ncbi:helix-turn-helix domain-containing protein [Aurantimonas aggregata]|uniref:Helix-turn-helix domain-containing protein n=1 Tax=Aurantimonas aggregata TaxID=2047720 RepID=A0A6L9MPF7_9HYPH|nr:helix-turn-helix domain-containing protein [Aurantimonas aggregata]
MQSSQITSAQIRAARGALGWSVQELGIRTEVSPATIKRYELASGVPRSRKGHLVSIRTAFEKAGIIFIGAPDDDPGIRIRTEV